MDKTRPFQSGVDRLINIQHTTLDVAIGHPQNLPDLGKLHVAEPHAGDDFGAAITREYLDAQQ
jgi:hypothetical protein